MNSLTQTDSPSSRPAARRPIPNRHVNGQGHHRPQQPQNGIKITKPYSDEWLSNLFLTEERGCLQLVNIEVGALIFA